MATRVQLNSFRFSIYIDADGTVTLTPPPEAAPPAGDSVGRQAPSEDLGNTESRG
jgi:hypothetical protein